MTTPEQPRERETRGAYYEIVWPLSSLIIGLRPFHMWDVGRRAHIQEGQRVLELGAGYPLWTIYSSRVGKTGTFIALDFNETINKRSRKITRLLNLRKEKPSEQIITADADKLPFLNETMDIIIANNLTTGEQGYKEAFRVLKTGGKLIDASTPFDHMATIKRVGFVNVERKMGIPFAFLPNWFVIASKPSIKDA